MSIENNDQDKIAEILKSRKRPRKRDFEPVEGYENLEVGLDRDYYNISFDDAEMSFRIYDGPTNLYETMIDASEEDMTVDAAVRANYASGKTGQVKARELEAFTDEEGYLLEELEEDLSKLGRELHPEL